MQCDLHHEVTHLPLVVWLPQLKPTAAVRATGERRGGLGCPRFEHPETSEAPCNRLTARVIEWCHAHPEPVPHTRNPHLQF